MKILNLDVITKEENKIILNGKEWAIPKLIKVEESLALVKINQKILEKPDNIDLHLEALKILFNILKKTNEKITFDEFRNMLSLKQYHQLSYFIMNPDIVDDEEDKEKKTE